MSPVNQFFFSLLEGVVCIERTVFGDGTLPCARGLCHGGHGHPQDVLRSRSWMRRRVKREALCIA